MTSIPNTLELLSIAAVLTPKLKPFTETDWYGMAGAERDAAGNMPLVAYGDPLPDGSAWIMTVDATGANLVKLNADGDELTNAYLKGEIYGRNPGVLDATFMEGGR